MSEAIKDRTGIKRMTGNGNQVAGETFTVSLDYRKIGNLEGINTNIPAIDQITGIQITIQLK